MLDDAARGVVTSQSTKLGLLEVEDGVRDALELSLVRMVLPMKQGDRNGRERAWFGFCASFFGEA